MTNEAQEMVPFKVNDAVECGGFSYVVKAVDGNRRLLTDEPFRAWNDQPITEFWADVVEDEIHYDRQEYDLNYTGVITALKQHIRELEAELAEHKRVRVALQTINSYSEDASAFKTWAEIIAGLEGLAHQLQAEALLAAGVSPEEVREIQGGKDATTATRESE